MLRDQAADTLPSVEGAASYALNQEEIDELIAQLAVALATHGEEDHKTKAILDRLEKFNVAKEAAIAKARKADPKGFGQDKAVAKGTKDLSKGTEDAKEAVGKYAKGTGAGEADTGREATGKDAKGVSAGESKK
jgi:hypothetical protein